MQIATAPHALDKPRRHTSMEPKRLAGLAMVVILMVALRGSRRESAVRHSEGRREGSRRWMSHTCSKGDPLRLKLTGGSGWWLVVPNRSPRPKTLPVLFADNRPDHSRHHSPYALRHNLMQSMPHTSQLEHRQPNSTSAL